MGLLVLRPTAYASGSTSFLQAGSIATVPSGTDIAAISDASDSTIVQAASGVAWTAKNTTYTLALSGTDIPAGRTIIKYRIGVRGGSFDNNQAKQWFAKVNSSEGPITYLAYKTPTNQIYNFYSPYATGLNGAVPTKAALNAAGITLSRLAVATNLGQNLFELWMEAVYNDLPPTPLIDTPSLNATYNVDNITVSGQISPTSSGARQKLIWEFATDAGFTANLRTYTEPDSLLRNNGNVYSSKLPDALKLFPGNWHVRAHAVDEYGLAGTGTLLIANIVISHPSSAVQLSPSGLGIPWNGGSVVFSWNFSDTAAPLDQQTAYQVQIYTADHGTLVSDTGKISSASTSATVLIPGAYSGVALSWRVQTWDEGDTTAGYTDYMSFTAFPPPTVAITFVDSASPAPEVDWTFTSTSGSQQTQYMVQLQDNGTGAVLYNSGWKSGNAGSLQVPSAVVLNNETVKATVWVQDSAGFLVSNTSVYTSAWALPASVTPTVDISNYGVEGFGYVKITWSGTSPAKDAQWHSYQVWRRLTGTTAWSIIYETTTNSASYEYDDYLAPSETQLDYAVVQTAIRSGTYQASAIPSQPVVVTVTPISFEYWLIDPTSPSTINLLLRNVTGDSYQENKEMEILQVIGRGQKGDFGTNWGITGSLTGQIFGTATKTARQIRDSIQAFGIAGKTVYLRNPFGDVYLVDLGQVSFERIGGAGQNDYQTVTIPYSQVS